MYYDDNYHPNNSNDDDNDDVTLNNESCSVYTLTSHISTNRKYQKKIADEVKCADKGYRCYKMNSVTPNGIKPVKIEVFDSGSCIGNRIRDPMSGARLTDRVGSANEYKYFKAHMSGIFAGKSATLFYDSPEHYERHHKTSISKDIKEKWHQARFSSLSSV
jgi:hypothetical protein